jgi:hypothetical protein
VDSSKAGADVPLTVGVFISHSFHDHDHLSSVDIFRQSIRSCCEEIKVEPTSDQPAFDLYFEDATFGKPLANAIRAEIAKRDIFLVDISGGSANVFYELGFAHALGKELIIVQASVAPRAPIPADITDLLVAFYNSAPDLISKIKPRIASFVRTRIAEERISTEQRWDRCFWFDRSVHEIHIVCGQEPEKTRFAQSESEDYLFIDNLDDRDALFDISMFLSRAYPDARLYRHSSGSLPNDVIGANMVLIGGPNTNHVAKEIMEQLGANCRYVQNDRAIEFETGGGLKTVTSRNDGAGVLDIDAGYFGRFLNPYDRLNHIILCQGCHTFGTLAASRILADSNQARDNVKLLKKIAKRDPSGIERIECVFEIKILKSRGLAPPVLDAAMVRIQ